MNFRSFLRAVYHIKTCFRLDIMLVEIGFAMNLRYKILIVWLFYGI